MAIELIAKIKQANNGTFKLLDAIDVELKDGSDLQSTVDFLKENSSSLELDGELTSDYNISVNTKEVSEGYGSINENLYQQFATLFKDMQNVIDTQQTKINDLEARVFALEQGSIIKPPIIDDSTSIVDYNGDILADYDGNTLSDYSNNQSDINYTALTDYDNNILVDYDNNILSDYVTTEIITYTQITDYSGNAIGDYNNNVLIEYDTTNVIYLSDYQENTVVDNENNYIIEKER